MWNETILDSDDAVLDALLDLQGRGSWLSRGQGKIRSALVPSIDRGCLSPLTRQEKLARERRSISLFRSAARFFSSDGEQSSLSDDFVALMVLRHHGVPTRLLDWSASPYVAAYFAVADHDDNDAELWSFNRAEYERLGREQWKQWRATTSDQSGDPGKFAAGLTAFDVNQPPDWLIAAFYPSGFPRQNAQQGAYTLTARFCIDHAVALATLLDDPRQHHRYIIKASLKDRLRTVLRADFGVWKGSLFPDTSGAAGLATEAFDL